MDKKKELVMKAYVPLENDVVKNVLTWLGYKNILAWRQNNNAVFDRKQGKYRKFNGMRGLSDIIAVLSGGKVVFIECKREGNLSGQSDEQKLFEKEVTERGCHYILCDKQEIVEQYFKEHFGIE